VLVKPYNIYHRINIFDYLSGIDYGDLNTIPGHVADSLLAMEKGLDNVVEKGVTPVVLGGDHTITLAELRSLAKKHGPLALVHIDAHLDTADEYFGKKYNHGTPFRRATEEGLVDPGKSIQIGIRGSFYGEEDLESSKQLGFKVITAPELFDMGIEECLKQIHRRVGGAKAFLSFDIDGIDPSCAPGTGTIEPGGINSREAYQIIRGMAGLNLKGFDIVEVLPALDPQQITAHLAANLAMEFISLLAVNKKNGEYN
jgi:agmatinase